MRISDFEAMENFGEVVLSDWILLRGSRLEYPGLPVGKVLRSKEGKYFQYFEKTGHYRVANNGDRFGNFDLVEEMAEEILSDLDKTGLLPGEYAAQSCKYPTFAKLYEDWMINKSKSLNSQR